MTTYKYTALSRSGQKVTGVIEGSNELDAVSRIKSEYDIILKITEVKGKGEGLLNLEIGGKKLDAKAFTVMCSQFAIILKAGIPIARTMQLVADKTTNKPLKKMLKEVSEDVEGGRSVAASFQDRGEGLLPPTFVETIRSGEESGNLDHAFESMYISYNKVVKMRAKVRGALAYPLFVLGVAVVVVMVLMVKVVPTFTAIFDSLGGELPLMARMLIGTSNFFRDNILFMLAIVVAVFLAYKIYGRTQSGRLRLAKTALNVPMLGNISLLNAASQFSNTMCIMLAAGLPMTRALAITAKTLDNYYISQEVGKLTGKLEQGNSLGPSMREQDILPDILVDMVAVGEETGELEETLRTIGDYYDAELQTAINAAMAKLEPTLLCILAVIVGFIVIAIYGSMFGMYALM